MQNRIDPFLKHLHNIVIDENLQIHSSLKLIKILFAIINYHEYQLLVETLYPNRDTETAFVNISKLTDLFIRLYGEHMYNPSELLSNYDLLALSQLILDGYKRFENTNIAGLKTQLEQIQEKLINQTEADELDDEVVDALLEPEGSADNLLLPPYAEILKNPDLDVRNRLLVLHFMKKLDAADFKFSDLNKALMYCASNPATFRDLKEWIFMLAQDDEVGIEAVQVRLRKLLLHYEVNEMSIKSKIPVLELLQEANLRLASLENLPNSNANNNTNNSNNSNNINNDNNNSDNNNRLFSRKRSANVTDNFDVFVDNVQNTQSNKSRRQQGPGN